ncbi:uncharacterized protein DUF5134 [Tamaricihabitans halophyticus]|uniref:Uncharacterized protein DUF5134 n=1 Tax=Tamaricihabitans halophyticus TaxID=1262583 RepID=A0A4R2Q2I3_9PSEU|nr:DUF5134 domain-containing protein [Tamaricihabitans halophyticus]TCP42629.1 uncharacterized protein DUF5134 [Tamaricihabitans halophyticus]
MIDAPVLRWLLTLVFAATTLWYARVLVLPAARLAVRVDAAWHMLMSIAMVAMAWPWGMSLPTVPQTVLFGVASVWFIGRIAFHRGGDHAGTLAASRSAGVHHAAMMAAMAWMVASMPSLMSGHGSDSGGGQHHHALAGGAAIPVAEASQAAAPTALVVANVVLGAVCIIACLPWLAQAFDLGRGLTGSRSPGLGRVVVDRCCHAAMTFGMGVMFLAMSSG